jgi:GNAT superfamily N-acetyltransferase
LFFNKAYFDCECFAEICDDEAVSAFYLLKCFIKKDGKMFNGRYLYAAATLSEYRGQGLMSKLIKEALDYGKSNELDFIALVPADDGLYNYYSRFGFSESMYKYRYSIDKGTATMRAYREITDSQEFSLIRNSLDCNMLVYGDICNEYAYNCLRFYGTRLFYINDKSYYAEGEELLSDDSDIAVSFINNLSGETVIYTNCNIASAEKIRNGMIFSFKNNCIFDDIYMNLALD